MYEREIARIQRLRIDRSNMKKQLLKDIPLDVVRIDLKKLRGEVAAAENGHLPETD